MFCPKRSHESKLKRLAQYLKHTQDCGLLLDPNSDIIKVDAYPDDEFSGMYGHNKYDDPACAKSCTGFIFSSANCPVLWISRLQSETTLSTTVSEKSSLANGCWELFPIVDITQSLGKAFGLPVGIPYIKVPVHEKNAGALILSRTFPP